MINIKQEIIKALKKEYGIKVSGEHTSQAFEPPRFFVKELLFQYSREIGGFRRGNYSFVIQYFPDGLDPNRECREMEKALWQLFDFFKELKLWPTSQSSEIAESVLHFFLDFSVRFEVEREDLERMQDLSVRSDLIE